MELIKKEIITKVGYDNRGLIAWVERTDEEIVRCKDCKWKELCEKTLEYKGADGYCSKGERKE